MFGVINKPQFDTSSLKRGRFYRVTINKFVPDFPTYGGTCSVYNCVLLDVAPFKLYVGCMKSEGQLEQKGTLTSTDIQDYMELKVIDIEDVINDNLTILEIKEA